MAGQNVTEFTDQNFEEEVLKSTTPVLVDFWAEWCMPCRMLAPTIEKIASDYAGKVKVGKVDTDANREISIKYGMLDPSITVRPAHQDHRPHVGCCRRLTCVSSFRMDISGSSLLPECPCCLQNDRLALLCSTAVRSCLGLQEWPWLGF